MFFLFCLTRTQAREWSSALQSLTGWCGQVLFLAIEIWLNQPAYWASPADQYIAKSRATPCRPCSVQSELPNLSWLNVTYSFFFSYHLLLVVFSSSTICLTHHANGQITHSLGSLFGRWIRVGLSLSGLLIHPILVKVHATELIRSRTRRQNSHFDKQCARKLGRFS